MKLSLGQGVRLGLGLAVCAVALAGCETSGVFKKRTDLVVAPANCSAKRFDIYFADGQASLTDAARQAIDLTAGQLEGCHISSIKVLGLADAKGDTSANAVLSQRRADTVVRALRRSGWPAPAFDVGAAGDEGAITGGVREPLRRRTEVLVEASAR